MVPAKATLVIAFLTSKIQTLETVPKHKLREPTVLLSVMTGSLVRCLPIAMLVLGPPGVPVSKIPLSPALDFLSSQMLMKETA